MADPSTQKQAPIGGVCGDEVAVDPEVKRVCAVSGGVLRKDVPGADTLANHRTACTMRDQHEQKQTGRRGEIETPSRRNLLVPAHPVPGLEPARGGCLLVVSVPSCHLPGPGTADGTPISMGYIAAT